MVQKYLLAAFSQPRHPPEFTQFYLETMMAGVTFRGATFCIRAINPFSTVHYMISEKHKKRFFMEGKGLKCGMLQQ